MTRYRDLAPGTEFTFEGDAEGHVYIKDARPSRAHRADVPAKNGFSLKDNPVVLPRTSKIVPDHVKPGSKEHLDALSKFFGI